MLIDGVPILLLPPFPQYQVSKLYMYPLGSRLMCIAWALVMHDSGWNIVLLWGYTRPFNINDTGLLALSIWSSSLKLFNQRRSQRRSTRRTWRRSGYSHHGNIKAPWKKDASFFTSIRETGTYYNGCIYYESCYSTAVVNVNIISIPCLANVGVYRLVVNGVLSGGSIMVARNKYRQRTPCHSVCTLSFG